MGRPINKRYFGALSSQDDSTVKPKNDQYWNIPVAAAFIGNPTLSEVGFELHIVKQRGTRTFIVANPEDNSTAKCRLVDKAGAGTDSTAFGLTAGEMVIVGYVNGNSNNAVTIKKMFNRTCVDFNNNRYKWETQNDSTTTILSLTAI